jgi:hypothetical protein
VRPGLQLCTGEPRPGIGLSGCSEISLSFGARKEPAGSVIEATLRG